MTDRSLFRFIVAGIALVFSMGVEAQLHVASSGDVGLGTLLPDQAFHVKVGGAQILVEETSSVSATRTLFALENKGLTKFFINNTDAGITWAFANKGSSFRISRQGSGAVEMEVFNNGNVTIQGTLTENSDVNAKTSIEAVDARSVLKRVSDMHITQWQYKDALGEKHIGPMAQDFYAAFGLGADEKGISTIDTAGVALVAIQALSDENKALRDRLVVLENQQHEMRSMVIMLMEAQRASSVLTKTAMN